MPGEPILLSSDLAELQHLSDTSLPHSARVLTPVLVRSPGGVTSVTYPDASSVPAVPCRVQQATAETIAKLRAEQFATLPLRVVAFSVDDVSEEQLVTDAHIIVNGETNGIAWVASLTVVGHEPHRSYQTQRRALCVPLVAT